MGTDVTTAKRGKDFVKVAMKSPNLVDHRCAGDHHTFTTKQGRVTVAASDYEYPPYVRTKIRREFIAIGLALVVIAVLAVFAL